MSWLSVAIHWTDEHSGAVTALGSIVAIASGFLVVRYQLRQEQREAREIVRVRAQTLAVWLLPYVRDFYDALTDAIGKGPDHTVSINAFLEDVRPQCYVFKDLAPSLIIMFGETSIAVNKSIGRRRDPSRYSATDPVTEDAEIRRLQAIAGRAVTELENLVAEMAKP